MRDGTDGREHNSKQRRRRHAQPDDVRRRIEPHTRVNNVVLLNKCPDGLAFVSHLRLASDASVSIHFQHDLVVALPERYNAPSDAAVRVHDVSAVQVALLQHCSVRCTHDPARCADDLGIVQETRAEDIVAAGRLRALLVKDVDGDGMFEMPEAIQGVFLNVFVFSFCHEACKDLAQPERPIYNVMEVVLLGFEVGPIGVARTTCDASGSALSGPVRIQQLLLAQIAIHR